MNLKAKRRTLIDPVLLLLKSRRVMIALSSLVVAVVVTYIPALAAFHTELLTLVVALAIALITGLSIEDAVVAARQTKLESNVQELLEKAMHIAFEELFNLDDLYWDTDEDEKSPDSAKDNSHNYEI